jgi:hypothetical protein
VTAKLKKYSFDFQFNGKANAIIKAHSQEEARQILEYDEPWFEKGAYDIEIRQVFCEEIK